MVESGNNLHTKVRRGERTNKTPVGKYAKDGECWLTIRIPTDVKGIISRLAANNDRSESYIARCLLLSKLNQILCRQVEDFSDRIAIPDVFFESVGSESKESNK